MLSTFQLPKYGKISLPVFFYIYGGMFKNGDVTADYDFQLLIGTGIVVVTVNFRNGPLGMNAQ